MQVGTVAAPIALLNEFTAQSVAEYVRALEEYLKPKPTQAPAPTAAPAPAAAPGPAAAPSAPVPSPEPGPTPPKPELLVNVMARIVAVAQVGRHAEGVGVSGA